MCLLKITVKRMRMYILTRKTSARQYFQKQGAIIIYRNLK